MTAVVELRQLQVAEDHAQSVLDDESNEDIRGDIANAITLLRCAKHLIQKREQIREIRARLEKKKSS